MSRSRLIPLALGVTLLLAIVAIASRGRPLRSGGGRGGLPLSFWDFSFTTVVIVLALILLACVVMAFFARTGWRKPQNSFQGHMIATIAAFALVAMIGTILARHHLFQRLHLPQEQGPPPSPGGHGHHGGTSVATRAPRLRWEEIAVVLGIILVSAATYGVLRSRRVPRLFGPGRDAPDSLALALDQSIDDLRADPDLRRAIIAAYARMEAALGVAGVPRRPSEAPLEYLERALLNLHASGEAVRRLTDLFEWARFSHHEPEPSMRDDAVDAFVAVRDELRDSELIPA
ncbi:MAG TPA: DUF4129 domain-containing protein [Gaiellaceae bacterium]|nr:DUF4129 domain-containing protein [Gaiellaceae bacterium]